MRNKCGYLIVCLFLLSTDLKANDWSKTNLNAMSDGCVDSLYTSSVKSYEARAEAAGNPKEPIPTEVASELKKSLSSLCSCLFKRISKDHSYSDVIANKNIAAPYIEEAFKGGQCKPTGILGKAIGNK